MKVKYYTLFYNALYMGNTPPNTFDLVQYAESAEQNRKVSSYEILKRDVWPKVVEFVETLRENPPIANEGKMHVIVLGMGGTFQSARLDNNAIAPAGTLKESFEALRFPHKDSHIYSLFDVMNIDSSQATVEQWTFLAEVIDYLYQQVLDRFHGIIITHGTDTMALAGSYLSFMLLGYPKSIILTGSQIPARRSDTDAGSQMERAVQTLELAREKEVCEVIVCCGRYATRGTWAIKKGDHTSNAFAPWNTREETVDADDIRSVSDKGEFFRLSPELIDFNNGKLRTKIAGHAITKRKLPTYSPCFTMRCSSNIIPVSLSDVSPVNLAGHIIAQKVSVLTQLGSATADDVLVDVVMQSAIGNKAIIFQAAFHDSTIQVGTYEAGSGMAKMLSNIQGKIPVINTSPSTFRAKINWAMNRLGMREPENQIFIEGLGVTYPNDVLRRFYNIMETNYIGELV